MADKKAKKKTESRSTAPVEAVITRISAQDNKRVEKKPTSSSANKATKKKRPLKGFVGYFKGAWQELKQVRWPNRRTTWKLTAAVIVFTAIFVAIIVLLDMGFDLLLDKIN